MGTIPEISMFSLYKKIKKCVREQEKLIADFVIEYGIGDGLSADILSQFEERCARLKKERKRVRFLEAELRHKKPALRSAIGREIAKEDA